MHAVSRAVEARRSGAQKQNYHLFAPPNRVPAAIFESDLPASQIDRDPGVCWLEHSHLLHSGYAPPTHGQSPSWSHWKDMTGPLLGRFRHPSRPEEMFLGCWRPEAESAGCFSLTTLKFSTLIHEERDREPGYQATLVGRGLRRKLVSRLSTFETGVLMSSAI